MAGVRKKPNPGGKYHGWFMDAVGHRKFFTGTLNRSETLRMAKRLEDEHRQIRLGYRPIPSSADKQRQCPFAEVKAEYLSRGERPRGAEEGDHGQPGTHRNVAPTLTGGKSIWA